MRRLYTAVFILLVALRPLDSILINSVNIFSVMLTGKMQKLRFIRHAAPRDAHLRLVLIADNPVYVAIPA